MIRKKIKDLMEGFGAGFVEVVVAFKLYLKDRKGFMASDYGMEQGSTPQVEGTAWGKAQDMCVDR